jgi:hypothetical protein
MATSTKAPATKKTASTSTTKAPSTKEVTDTSSAVTTAMVKDLQKEIVALREEITTLKVQVSSLSVNKAAPATSNSNDGAQLATKVMKIFRAIGVKEWQLRDAGLK